jgi:hypothetical protein
MDLNDEDLRATALLEGLVVKSVVRHRPTEVAVIFTDGSRLFVDWQENKTLELSITSGCDSDD